MSTASHLKVRDARDRLIDLLGLGQTYPLRDVDVQEQQLTVDFNQQSAIDIEPGQLGVTYELYDPELTAAPISTAAGSGEKTTLFGPVITKDKTFRILAKKTARPERSAYLLQSAVLKVGLNTKLRAFMPAAVALNPAHTSPADTDPRIVDYGSVVTVRVIGAQAAARYQLEYKDATGNLVTTSPVIGTGADIDLVTPPMLEDTQVRVRVTRIFDPAEGRANLGALLDVVLTLAVRANPAIALSVEGTSRDGSPLVDPAGAATLTAVGSQRSVVYSAYVRPLLDGDFVAGGAGTAQLLAVAVPASVDVPAHTVFVRAPPRPSPFQVQSGYTQRGESSAGNGAELKLNLGPIHDDSMVLVQARKDHKDPASGQSIGQSALQLTQAVVVLPRPDQATALALMVAAASPGPGGTMVVTGGQLGVLYHFRLTAGAAELGLPAYFHRVDEQDEQQNRGIEQLQVEADFFIARTVPSPSGDLSRQRPLTPVIELAQIPAGSTLSVTAVWTRTGVAWLAARTVPITKT